VRDCIEYALINTSSDLFLIERASAQR